MAVAPRTGGSLGRSVTLLAGGATLAQIIPLAVSPLLTRLYDPTAFGVAAAFAAVIAIAASAANLGYVIAIPLAEDARAAYTLLSLSLWLTVASLPVSVALLVLFGDNLVEAVDSPDLRAYLWLVPLGILQLSGYQALYYFAIWARQFRVVASTRASQAVGAAAAQLGLSQASSGPLGLIVGQLVGQSFGLASLARIVAGTPDRGPVRVPLADLRRVATDFRKFPLYTLPATLLYALSAQLPTLLLAGLISPAVAGLFAVATKVTRSPAAMISTAVSQAFYGDAADWHRQGQLGERTLGAYRALVRLGTPALAVLSATGTVLFSVVFGPEWAQAGTYSQWLAPSLLLGFVAAPLSTVVFVLGRQRTDALLQLGSLALKVTGILVGALQGSGSLAVAGFALATMVSLLVQMAWMMGLLHLAPGRWIRPFATELAICLPACAVLAGLSWEATTRGSLALSWAAAILAGVTALGLTWWRARPLLATLRRRAPRA